MRIIANILDREIKYLEFDTSKDWAADLPKDNWCLIIIANEKNTNYFNEILRKSIDRNVGYICGIGKQHELIHKMADEEIQYREVKNDQHLPSHLIFTVGDENFENGLWSDIYTTHNIESDINEIVIVDITKNSFEEIVKLVEKFNSGYMPEE